MRVRKLEEYFSTHKNHICLDKNSPGRKKLKQAKKDKWLRRDFGIETSTELSWLAKAWLDKTRWSNMEFSKIRFHSFNKGNIPSSIDSSITTISCCKSSNWLSNDNCRPESCESFICMLANKCKKPTTASQSLLWARACWFPSQGP